MPCHSEIGQSKSLFLLTVVLLCFQVKKPHLAMSLQSALSDLLTTSATHGTFSRPSAKRGHISIIKLLQFTIVRLFQASLGEALFQKACH